VLGPTEATVNLWISDAEVSFDLESLPSRDDYLITTRAALEPGVYAFHAQDVLNEEDERVLMNLPKEMQVAFPFEVM
jgi:DNA-binding FadR family transcriptional regulator